MWSVVFASEIDDSPHNMVHQAMPPATPAGKQLQKVADLISEGKVKVIVDKIFPLKDAAYVTSS